MSNARLNLFWILVFALTLPIGVILSTRLATRSFEKVKLRDQVITVKGYAERTIVADRGEWSVTIAARDKEMVPAYARLETGRKRVLEFLEQHGYKPDQVELASVSIGLLKVRNPKGEETNQIEGYVLTQTLSVAGGDTAQVAKASRAASDLIREGIELSSRSPSYVYTKLDDMKLKMLAEATENARQRALHLVANSGSALGPLRHANQGVFQIVPEFSTEVSDSGQNDTSTIRKTIKAVVTMEWAIQ